MIDPALAADLVRESAIGIVGMGLLAALVALLVAAGYRWVSTRSPPAGVPTFVALSIVSASLSVRAFGPGTLLESVRLEHHVGAGYLIATMLVAGVTATAAGRLGDRIACQVTDQSRIDANGEVAETVRAAGVAVDVALPETIETADGYRPIGASVDRALSGARVRLPHGLSADRRRDRLERHLERAYGVDHATVKMADDGTVERVLVGNRPPGLGATVPPGMVAVAIRADPPPEASPADPVEVWSTNGRSRLITTGTLRATAGSCATVIVDAEAAFDLTDDERYRLVTRPAEPTDGYEFASTLRAASETVTSYHVDPDGPLVGEFVGWLPGRVLVIDRGDEPIPLPADSETLRGGDELWLLARPAELTAFDPAVGDDSSAEPGWSETGKRSNASA